jgi:hypothetical protein
MIWLVIESEGNTFCLAELNWKNVSFRMKMYTNMIAFTYWV